MAGPIKIIKQSRVRSRWQPAGIPRAGIPAFYVVWAATRFGRWEERERSACARNRGREREREREEEARREERGKSGERIDRRTRGRQYRIDLTEWTQLPTERPDLLLRRGPDWGLLMARWWQPLFTNESASSRDAHRIRRSPPLEGCRVALLTQLSEGSDNGLSPVLLYAYRMKRRVSS